MLREEIVKKLRKILSDVFLRDILVTETLTADEVEGWDSIMHVTLMVTIESEFNIQFRLGEVSKLKNVGQLIELIEKYDGQK